MKAIKIDSQKKQVSIINIKPTIESVYEAVGNNCTTVEIALKDLDKDIVLVDEDILQRPNDIKGCFYYGHYSGGMQIVGNAIILGTDSDGNWVEPRSKVSTIRDYVTFLPM